MSTNSPRTMNPALSIGTSPAHARASTPRSPARASSSRTPTMTAKSTDTDVIVML